jgi:hypothetical protein
MWRALEVEYAPRCSSQILRFLHLCICSACYLWFRSAVQVHFDWTNVIKNNGDPMNLWITLPGRLLTVPYLSYQRGAQPQTLDKFLGALYIRQCVHGFC